ncbi:hypothetical protein Maes01_01587 [Microbulbifer aestuariivivens]|uniref:NodB homology domain-containing protein n=1 Tax=Microbulbifer aestuariivivens TaxID=1908308 RepID=A0ABP9WPA6_9GAMM
MKTLLTLDYELFFGEKTGTAKACLIDATNRLLGVLAEYDARAVFFVDAAYLVRLRYFAQTYERVAEDYAAVIRQLQELETLGHQIQLHIHPHWFDTHYDGNQWQTDTRRYRLGDWSRNETGRIISECTRELNRHLKNKVFAFRAGGWCVQPWQHIGPFLLENGISIDCTVYSDGQCLDQPHLFDFSGSPTTGSWNFELEPCRVVRNGTYKELPISSTRVSPLFFWRFAVNRLFGDLSEHHTFGDGSAMPNSKRELVRKLTRNCSIPVSIDGFKSSLLRSAYLKALRNGKTHFVAMGHPKALSEFSLKNIRLWLSEVYGRGGRLELMKVITDNEEVQVSEPA